ncbi:MAG: hypothetical protein M3Z03_05255, partial [Actinomycetota bacterium]|nr:hypothetical protein [Actinomycetota bacterium]
PSGGSVDLPPLGGPAAVPSTPVGPTAPRPVPVVAVLDLRDVYPFLAILAALLAGSRLLASSLLRPRAGSRPEVRDLFRW